MLNELFPDAKNIGLVILLRRSKLRLPDWCGKGMNWTKMGYTCTEYSFADSNDIASVVTNATSASDVLYIPTDNSAAAATEVINNICEPAGIPIIAGEEGICHGCGVATLSISYYDLGYQTGLMAYEILANGADVSTMEVQFAPNVAKKYDAERCKTLGITVPDDYVAIE